MENEIVRLVGGWLEHATYGLAPKLLALDVTDGERPDAPAIVTELASGAVARYRVPSATTPSVLVSSWPETELRQEIQTQSVAGVSGVLLTYAVHEGVTQTGIRNASYILRAARWSLLDFNTYATEADVSLHGVTIEGVQSFRPMRRTPETKDDVLCCDLLCLFDVRDDFDAA